MKSVLVFSKPSTCHLRRVNPNAEFKYDEENPNVENPNAEYDEYLTQMHS